MNSQLPIVAKCHVNGITLEICQGNIPDIFRQLHFDPITEFELPDDKSEREFRTWITLYRRAQEWSARNLLSRSLCN